MTAKIFIDGAAGTTGLEIRERLSARADLTVVALPGAARKDDAARARALNDADLVILCLPDAASRQAISPISTFDKPTTLGRLKLRCTLGRRRSPSISRVRLPCSA